MIYSYDKHITADHREFIMKLAFTNMSGYQEGVHLINKTTSKYLVLFYRKHHRCRCPGVLEVFVEDEDDSSNPGLS